MVKFCNFCNRESEFYNSAPRGRCKVCRNEYAKNQYAIKARIIRAGKERPCMDCGEAYPHFVMDYDHTGDKNFNIGRDGHRYSVEVLELEIAMCDVVCANCHRFRTHTGTEFVSDPMTEKEFYG